jgi:hypothetical protein
MAKKVLTARADRQAQEMAARSTRRQPGPRSPGAGRGPLRYVEGGR